MNLAFNETMSFEIHIMSSETPLIWQSRSLVRDSGSKGNKWTEELLRRGEYARPTRLTSWILTISRLRLCKFTPDCLSNQWSLGTGETNLVAGEEKCSSGQLWYCSGYRGGEKLSGETQKCHRVGFHRVCCRGVLSKSNSDEYEL